MSDRPDPFEDELREALRSGGDSAKTDGDDSDTLKRIHRGAALRRRRRRAGTVVAVAALTGTIVVGAPIVSPTPESHQTAEPGASARTSEPTASRSGGQALEHQRKGTVTDVPTVKAPAGRFDAAQIRAGAPVGVHDLHLASVSGSAPDQFWVAGSGTCEGHLCNVLGVGDASGDSPDVEYRALPGSPRQSVTTVRFSGDGQTGWATNGAATFKTADGGQDWIRLKQPKGVRVVTLEAWGDEAWAVGYRSTTSTVVMATREDSDELTELRSVPDGVDPDQAVTLGPNAFGMAKADSAGGEFLRTGDGGLQWDRAKIGCSPADVSATSGAVWALCSGPRPQLVKSYDQGLTWPTVEPLPAATSDRPYMVAAIDTDTAFVASDNESWVVDRSVALPVEGLEGPYSYIGFTSADVGYVVDGFGGLRRTEDGGHTWESVDVP